MLLTTSFFHEGKFLNPCTATYHLQIAAVDFFDERGMTYDFGDIKAIYKCDYLESPFGSSLSQ